MRNKKGLNISWFVLVILLAIFLNPSTLLAQGTYECDDSCYLIVNDCEPYAEPPELQSGQCNPDYATCGDVNSCCLLVNTVCGETGPGGDCCPSLTCVEITEGNYGCRPAPTATPAPLPAPDPDSCGAKWSTLWARCVADNNYPCPDVYNISAQVTGDTWDTCECTCVDDQPSACNSVWNPGAAACVLDPNNICGDGYYFDIEGRSPDECVCFCLS
ncbi:hypothetical protein MUP65_00430, partial [Patescibacteria group bacterium]|nr:hypothetical protein [Patescibacteria group bacterium]